ncbi:hypothetical protein HELRODRAFT_177209 [Helobdella robusta]|uniref:SUEL-type lectin domain-containing protein n=1 Tax=Helobdella robusta TaxID=6412 RepID=T1FBC8_HELRO|nr:hypothetical protein HELRODRAFT_177209 [Helobdella robusta]ESN98324.1 hypothetical protein HELRODRAFT_177209 [Helobdella robusta]
MKFVMIQLELENDNKVVKIKHDDENDHVGNYISNDNTVKVEKKAIFFISFNCIIALSIIRNIALNNTTNPDNTIKQLGQRAEYCQWETFQASCPQPDYVILMTSARYGRMNFSRCVRENHGKVGCYADVVAILHDRCSGRKSCRSSVPNGELHRSLKDCPKELMPYLEADNDNLCASPSSSSSSSTFSSSSSSSWTSSLSETTTSASSNPPYTITDNNKNNNNNNNNINNINNKHNQHLIFSKRKDDKTSRSVDSKQLNVDGGLVIPFPSPSQPTSLSSSFPLSSSSSQLFDASRNEMNFCSWKIEVVPPSYFH